MPDGRSRPAGATPRPYYEAYDERYRTIHRLGHAWAADVPTPIVAEALARFVPDPAARLLELGCGEGRDARPLLAAGRNLTAAELSPEAVAWCRARDPAHAARYRVLDCVRGELPGQWDFIYAVALLHMLTEDADRQALLRFVREHLTPDGIALLCSMGDGETEFCSDPAEAFALREREHPAGPVRVAASSCRIVGFPTLEAELARAGLAVLERGLTAAPPEFDRLLYVLVRPAEGAAPGKTPSSSEWPEAEQAEN